MQSQTMHRRAWNLRATTFNAVVVAASLATAGCVDSRRIPTGVSEAPGHPALSTSADWPNEPAGSIVASDFSFGEVLPSGSAMPVGTSGWIINNPDTLATLATGVADAPLSPDSVGRWSFPAGYVGGAPAMMYLDPGSAKEVYFGVWWKSSSPFEAPGDGDSRILSVYDVSGNAAVLGMQATGGSAPRVLEVISPYAAVPGTHLAANVNATDVVLGQWHRIEWYMRYSTTGTSADGIVRWWIDGTLQGNYTNQQMPVDAGFGEFRVEPRWDSSAKAEQDFQWFDHVRVSTSSNRAWPNEPSGMTLVSDYGFDDAIPSGDGSPVGSSGWIINNTTACSQQSGLATQVTDVVDAPLSSPNVGQWSYPIGFAAGCAPAKMYIDAPEASAEVYFGLWWKPSDPWESEPASGTNKIAFILGDSGGAYIQMHGTETPGIYEMEVTPQFGGPTSGDPLHPNRTATNPVLGAWHQVEWYVKFSTDSTSGDGIIRWWMDGVLQGEYTALSMPDGQAHLPYEFQVSPTWGGVNSAKTEQDYYWYDHVHASRRAP